MPEKPEAAAPAEEADAPTEAAETAETREFIHPEHWESGAAFIGMRKEIYAGKTRYLDLNSVSTPRNFLHYVNEGGEVKQVPYPYERISLTAEVFSNSEYQSLITSKLARFREAMGTYNNQVNTIRKLWRQGSSFAAVSTLAAGSGTLGWGVLASDFGTVATESTGGLSELIGSLLPFADPFILGGLALLSVSAISTFVFMTKNVKAANTARRDLEEAAFELYAINNAIDKAENIVEGENVKRSGAIRIEGIAFKDQLKQTFDALEDYESLIAKNQLFGSGGDGWLRNIMQLQRGTPVGFFERIISRFATPGIYKTEYNVPGF